MMIIGKRRRKLDKHIQALAEVTRVIPGLAINEPIRDILLKTGFAEELNEGETVLPPSAFGPICRFNAEGKYIAANVFSDMIKLER